MFRRFATTALLGAACLLTPALAAARDLGVEISTDRGHEAVYQPGDAMQIKVRTTDDSYLLVYEIDSEGFVRVLFPEHNSDGQVEGHSMLQLPLPDSDLQLVVESSTGQSYLVAIASQAPFENLPWYLRAANVQGDELGYVNAPQQEEEGVTSDGRIVGDPFVAMERIRRRVLNRPDDAGTFATAYTSYYVEHAVRYPRYLCYDCHRPDQYAFWDGFDPYYTNCSVFDVRVNWGWHWGAGYWFGSVPYYVYVGRPGCPPRYVSYCAPGFWFSSWDGWGRWCSEWGGNGLRRYKSAPPVGYIPPTRYGPGAERTPASFIPPGYIAADTRRYRGASNPALPIGRNGTPRPVGDDNIDRGGSRERPVGVGPRQTRPGGTVERTPAGSGRDEGSSQPPRAPRPSFEPRTPPANPPSTPPREARPAPATPSRNDPPPPPQRIEAPTRTPRNESAPPTPRNNPAPSSTPRFEPHRDTQPTPSMQSTRQYRSWMAPGTNGGGMGRGGMGRGGMGRSGMTRGGVAGNGGTFRNNGSAPQSAGQLYAQRSAPASRPAGGGGGRQASGASGGHGGWSSRPR